MKLLKIVKFVRKRKLLVTNLLFVLLEVKEMFMTICFNTNFPGNKEKVRCDSGLEAFRACGKVTRIEERKFWIFEFVCALSGALSASIVFLRQKQLDHKMYQKIQRQIAAGV